MAQADIQASPSPPPPSQAESVAVSVCQLIGAVLFSCGSACFVRMAWVDDWVLPWRVGCVLWIGGCVPYLWPPLQQYLWPSIAKAGSSGVSRPRQQRMPGRRHAELDCGFGLCLLRQLGHRGTGDKRLGVPPVRRPATSTSAPLSRTERTQTDCTAHRPTRRRVLCYCWSIRWLYHGGRASSVRQLLLASGIAPQLREAMSRVLSGRLPGAARTRCLFQPRKLDL